MPNPGHPGVAPSRAKYGYKGCRNRFCIQRTGIQKYQARAEGPRGLATALRLLQRHNVEVEEYRVDQSFMDRLAASCLLRSDIDMIEGQTPVRPRRWYDYVYERGQDLDAEAKGLSRHYALTIPFILIDERIMDLAVRFHENEDTAIISAYRRLEDVFRKRTGLTGEGSKLFAKAFLTEEPLLRWDVPDEGESKGRANLFTAAYMAFRNARVHREIDEGSETALREFLLVNDLYRLEAEAMTDAEIKEKRQSDKELEDAMAALNMSQSASSL